MQKTCRSPEIPSLKAEDSLEAGTATHASLFPGESPGQRSLVGLQSTGSQRVRHSGATNTVALHLRSHLCQVATASGQGSVGLLGSGLVPCQAAGRGGSVWALRGAGFALHPRSNLFPRQTPTTNTQDCSQAPGAGTGTTANPWALPTSVPLPALPSALRVPEVLTALGAMGRERAGGVRVFHGAWLRYSSQQGRRARHFPFTDEGTEAGGA